MFQTISDFYVEAEKAIVSFNAFAAQHALVTRASADHICFKCDSREVFEHIRSMFETESRFIYQSIISGRRIVYLKFKKPIASALGDIWFLELSDQKPDRSQVNCFDHVEVYAHAMSYDDMVSELEKTEKLIKVERPHHTTHDVQVTPDFLFRCTQGPLIEKIQKEQME
jgi:predicted metalloenzyme YecM